MKLRIRSTETKETLRIETADPCPLHELKTLIAAKLSPPVPPEFICLSLNRKDELVAPSPRDSLQSLGLTSGDLLFFSIALAGALPLSPTATAETPDPHPNPPVKKPESGIRLPAEPMNETAEALDSDPPQVGESSVTQGDLMDVDSEPPEIKKAPSVPCLLKRAMEAEKGEVRGDIGRLVVAVHAVLLESGFVACGGSGSRLPEGWASPTAAISVQYTVPDLAGPPDGRDVKVAVLKFSAMGNYVSVYGFVSGDRPDVYRVCLDAPKLAPSLASSTDAMGEKEEKDVFQLWKTVKDGLSLPLLIDFCEKNGLPLPPCFSRLPTELKIRILEFLPGVDVARVACASPELRYLSSNDELWKQKFVEEFGLLDERGIIGRSWRDKFVKCCLKRKNAGRRPERARENIFQMPRVFVPRHNLFAPQRIPMIGGDYDLFPAIGGFGPSGPRLGFPHLPARRNFSHRCNLGGRDANFSM